MSTFKATLQSYYQGLTPGQTRAVTYAEYLASQTHIDISNENVNEFLNGIRTQQKRDINAYFFKTYGAKDAAAQETISKISEEMQSEYSRYSEEMLIAEKNRIESNMLSHLDSVRAYRARVNQYLIHYHAAKKQLDALEQKPVDWLKIEIEKILADKFWRFEERERQRLFFSTRSDVVLTEPAAKISLNMGKYKVSVSLEHYGLRLHKFENNICMGREDSDHPLIHPYGSHNEALCYGGEGGDKYHEFIQNREIAKAFELTKNTITYYNPSSTPYRTLAEFKNHLERHKVRDVNNSFDDDDEEPEDNSFNCDSCGEHRDNGDYHDSGICIYCHENNDESGDF